MDATSPDGAAAGTARDATRPGGAAAGIARDATSPGGGAAGVARNATSPGGAAAGIAPDPTSPGGADAAIDQPGTSPNSAVAGIDPEATTGWTLVRAHHAMARRFTETLARVGLTPTQFGVLVQLAEQPGVSQADLARRVLVTPQSMGELLAGLQRAGHVHRTSGRRGTASTITLTDAGRDALRSAAPLVARINEPAALGLTADENATLNRLLHKVRDALHDPS